MPTIKELCSTIAEKLAEKGFHRDCGNNNRLVIEHELETIEEVVELSAGVSALTEERDRLKGQSDEQVKLYDATYAKLIGVEADRDAYKSAEKLTREECQHWAGEYAKAWASLQSMREATLQEAAKAMCLHCATGHEVTFDPEDTEKPWMGYFHPTVANEDGPACRAPQIQKLKRAALSAEGSKP